MLLRCVPLISFGLWAASTFCLAQEPDFKHENKPDNLKALFTKLHQAIHVRKDTPRAAALFRALLPDAERLKKVLKDDVPKASLDAIAAMHQKQRDVPLTAEELAKLAPPKQTVVQVHGATTEEIAKYEKGSVAWKEFPGGTQRVAAQVLRPKMTYYEVEFLEPGKDAGMKYHLFCWDGKQWTMLGPLWRVLK